MALNEFSLIQHYFSSATSKRADVIVDIGDDCAVLACPADKHLAVSIDTLVAGTHFFHDVAPKTLGHKSLAVSLSDLAAMGAQPAWFTLALTLPEIDEDWLKAYAEGLAELAESHRIQLVGGDTTKGPLSISIQVHGFVEHGKQIQRSGAKKGDKIFVTGCLGDAGAALKQRLENWDSVDLDANDCRYLSRRLEMPTPRNSESEQLLPFMTAAIDVSDGLLADISHILSSSQVGADIHLANLPLSPSLQKIDLHLAQTLALTAGDDYELCFTVPDSMVNDLLALN
ncbi:MAG TPA: thiamine-phosphate kinase, partial [Methylophaga aminisulfidivorans]|nr:thiamine-phosphate kinase [Methylophaga aminisulfidivorans]